jgi:WD40 repeat protein/transcriptional regulator with XRE-family HTH domain
LLLRHRGRTRLTQRALAAGAGTSRRSIQDWESGVYHPSAERLQALILVLLESGGFTVGQEIEAAEELWAAVLREAPRMRTPLDKAWLDRLLHERAAPREAPEHARELVPAPPVVGAAEVGAVERGEDWGEAPDVLGFVGRADELLTLSWWVLAEHCRLAAVLGMGGIGKTALAARLAQEVAPVFQRVYWRSLRDALPTSEWLAGAIGFLSDQQLVPPEGEAKQLAALLELLRDRPCLLVLDNFETVLEPGQREGRYRDGFGGYGKVLQAIGEGRHRSCLVLTSREAPSELAIVGGAAVRSFELGGLGVAEGQVLLADKQLSGNPADWATLIGQLGGNGLALKMVGESIREVFGGDIGAFLEESGALAVFGGIRRVLAEQLERSSAVEQTVLRVAAVEREPVTIAELIANLGPRVRRGAVLEALEALRRRSLVERAETAGAAAFTLQSVVLEYATDRLVQDVCDEIARGQPLQLVEQPLIKAQAKEYVRQSQERLLGEPVLQRLTAESGHRGAERLLLALLDGWRNRPVAEQGYGPGNVVNLLRLQRGDLRSFDLTRLALRQAYLAGVEAQDASLAGAHLSEAVLAESFNLPICAALSGDGAYLVAGTVVGEVWLWRVADRTLLLAVQGHTSPVQGVALSADGQLLATGSADGTVRLWAASSGQLLTTLEGHTGGVRAVGLSADGRLLASGSVDGSIRLWAAPSGRLLATLQGHNGPVYGLALSADGRLLASGGLDGALRLWEVPGGRPLATLQAHTSGVWGVALSADGRLLASGGLDGTLRLWETPSERLLATLQGRGGPVYSVALSADGRLLVSGSVDGSLRLWDAHSGRALAALQGHTAPGYSVALSSDGRLLASASEDGSVRLWETPTGRLLASLQGLSTGVYGVAMSTDGRVLASGRQDGTIRLWEASGGQLLATLRGHTGLVFSVALSADGRLLTSGSMDGTVRLWAAQPSGWHLLATLRGHSGAVQGVALSADEQLVASGSLDGTVRLWAVPSGRLQATLEGNTSAVSSVALSTDGRLVASGGLDGMVRLWAAGDGRLLATLKGHTGMVQCVAVSADGRLLASGSWDGTVRLWETPGGRLLATLSGHAGGVRGVALSADGRLLASGGQDGTVRLWETGSGLLLATLQGHTSAVWGVTLSMDGLLLASSSLDGTIRLWEASSGAWLRTLRTDRRYERLDISGLTGVTAAQRAALLTLGAVDHTSSGAGMR